jgi:hypothetical protein
MVEVEDALAAVRLREGTYTTGRGNPRVYFQDRGTVRDVADLYAVLKEEASTGSPNLENELARAWLEKLQQGALLSNEQLAKLFELMEKYGDEIKAFRASSDRSQDILNVPDGANARLVKRGGKR